MKNIEYILLALFALCGFSSCEKHDTIDDMARVGEQTPYVFWELETTTVKAGTGVPFRAQYYTNGEEIDHLSVWYSINQTIDMEAKCPIATGFNYSYIINHATLSRVNQEIVTYPHNENYWDSQLKAYLLVTTFPTSNTLLPVEWRDPADFDMQKYNQLFPDTFAIKFQDGLYGNLSQSRYLSDYRKVLVSTGFLTTEQFDACVDSTFNQNSNSWDKFVKDNQVEYLKGIYYTIPFETLMYNSAESKYQINYLKSFKLKATFRALDKKNVQGISDEFEITIN